MSNDRTCPNCGAALMPADVFCGECGMRTAPDEQPAAPPPPADTSAAAEQEPLPETEPSAGAYLPPEPAKSQGDSSTVIRIVAIVAAASFLVASLCFCSLGVLALMGESDLTTQENVGFATALCFAPGVILGLLGLGAGWLAFRKRK